MPLASILAAATTGSSGQLLRRDKRRVRHPSSLIAPHDAALVSGLGEALAFSFYTSWRRDGVHKIGSTPQALGARLRYTLLTYFVGP